MRRRRGGRIGLVWNAIANENKNILEDTDADGNE